MWFDYFKKEKLPELTSYYILKYGPQFWADSMILGTAIGLELLRRFGN